MRDTDYQVRRTCVQALARQGKTVVEALLPLLQESRPEVREACIQTVGMVRDPAAADALKLCLQDPHQAIGEAAWKALELLAWPPAREREKVRRWNVRSAAEESLARWQTNGPALEQAAQESHLPGP